MSAERDAARIAIPDTALFPIRVIAEIYGRSEMQLTAVRYILRDHSATALATGAALARPATVTVIPCP
jgi:hypothetical protein